MCEIYAISYFINKALECLDSATEMKDSHEELFKLGEIELATKAWDEMEAWLNESVKCLVYAVAGDFSDDVIIDVEEHLALAEYM